MQVPFVDLRAQQQPIREQLTQAIQRIVETTSFVLGEDVAQFEAAFAAYCGTSEAIGVDSGLSALKLALLAYGIGAGDEVIIPANTFVATAAAATFAGATPVFVDVDEETANIDANRIEAAITPRTKAIIPVHLYGQPAEMDTIMALAAAHNLVVIEDACQAHGARYKGRRAGSLGHAAAFSFYPSKNLGAFGDGGIVVTDDADIAARIRAMRNCGQIEKNKHELPPYNHRLDTLHAAVLCVELEQLDHWNAARQRGAARYNGLLAGVELPGVIDDVDPVWHLYVIRTPNRDATRAALGDRGIATGIHYPIPVPFQPVYGELGYRRGDFPVAERLADQIISLPMYPDLSDEAIDYIARSLKEVTGKVMV